MDMCGSQYFIFYFDWAFFKSQFMFSAQDGIFYGPRSRPKSRSMFSAQIILIPIFFMGPVLGP
jgi:hypothetical protein